MDKPAFNKKSFSKQISIDKTLFSKLALTSKSNENALKNPFTMLKNMANYTKKLSKDL